MHTTQINLSMPIPIGCLLNGKAFHQVDVELSYDDYFEKMRHWAEVNCEGWAVLLFGSNGAVEKCTWLFNRGDDATRFKLTWMGDQ